MDNIRYSIVVAAFNEEEVLPMFFEKVISVFEGLKENFEIIVVNDGSRDRTEDILKETCLKDKRVRGISLSRNFGQQAALMCGLKESRGDAVIVMDADLQDPPEIAVKMTEKWKEGYDIVHGKHRKRPGESLFKRATAKMYYGFLSRISSPKVPEETGDFKLYSRRAADTLISLPDCARYIRGTAAWIGFKQAFVEFDRPAREVGETKYTLKKMVRLAISGITSNSTYPLTLALKTGVTFGVLSAIAFLTFIILAVCKVALPLAAWLFPTVVLLFGISLIIKGLTDIYTAKIYEEVRNRPAYIIKEKFGIEEK